MGVKDAKVGHTPGPWEVSGEITGLGAVVASLGRTLDDEVYFINAKRVIPDVEVPANARLIAAAPDLLEALRDAVEVIKDCAAMPIDTSRFDAAIAKAEGGES